MSGYLRCRNCDSAFTKDGALNLIKLERMFGRKLERFGFICPACRSDSKSFLFKDEEQQELKLK